MQNKMGESLQLQRKTLLVMMQILFTDDWQVTSVHAESPLHGVHSDSVTSHSKLISYF